MPTAILHILEIIGTISFAASGSMTAIRARLDLFGVIFVGSVTAIGGGLIRDVLIGQHPPAVFLHFPVFLTAVITSAFFFLISYKNSTGLNVLSEKFENVNTVFDAIGLAAFSVMGTEISCTAGFADNLFFSVALGTLTGIGGGMFRDILTAATPYVLKKHVYATAAIFGSLIYYLLRKDFAGLFWPSVISMLFVILIRLLAAKYRWNLPRIPVNADKNEQP